ncbi:aminomethyl-transferring glycine dehydrogenase [Actinomyces vulturis]|uniref:aminomethyl-transferring glycine dehydrogenase n=1 Tax=Actinomyces vulturis TaxID=1857645 RepID=UPI000B03522F|nr:aminomethyl-transferring glycine dehydrogenase [Actinomyces vulturis]
MVTNAHSQMTGAGHWLPNPTASFASRHYGLDDEALNAMVNALGVKDIDDLLSKVLPSELITAPDDVNYPEPLSEAAALARYTELAAKNDPHVEMIGQGYYPSHTPSVIARDVLTNPAWLTAYTPYQSEISQGRLEAQMVFQTAMSSLTGLEVATASLLDEATAVAEAMLLIRRATRGEGVVLLHPGLHPQCLDVALARAKAVDLDIIISEKIPAPQAGPALLGAVVPHILSTGQINTQLPAMIEAIHAHKGALAAVGVDPLALTLLESPGALGADIAVGTSQRLGVPLFFGGPHAAFITTTKALARKIPGRLVGVAPDRNGNAALRLSLQTREQHIRREKATSNICTAQALLAVVAAMYCVYHGPDGLKSIARHAHTCAVTLRDHINAHRDMTEGITGAGKEPIFDTLTVQCADAHALAQACADEGINIRVVDEDLASISCNETTTAAHLDALCRAMGLPEVSEKPAPPCPVTEDVHDCLTREYLSSTDLGVDDVLVRHSDYLTHHVFCDHHSETGLMRYLRTLADRDLALDRTMIPLGSCTLKLNAASQGATLLNPAMAGIHPYAPSSQTAGWRELLGDISQRLATITGYDQVSLQPNSGAQGELAGLLAIRGYVDSIGESHRRLCLVPASAHGTNAASAASAGLTVVTVATAEDGSIDVDDLARLLQERGNDVAAIMLTYPSTHGVFEPQVVEVCRMVHEAGAQVYIDGANLNALCGLVRPGDLGGDVSHLNLHKTFAIPHGGGGPGVGPIAAKSHLAPFMPGLPTGSAPALPEDSDAKFAGAPVSGARFGSAGVIPLSWMYVVMMSWRDLGRATMGAIVSANTISRALADSFPTLYTGHSGYVAHECIVDLRQITHDTGVTAEDVAKRLIDYGFHAPTLAFPVAGTLMIEPTESEPVTEINRFIQAMNLIREEIAEIERGDVSVESSVLRLSPHTAREVTADDWNRVYSRSQAAFPWGDTPWRDKYFPPVTRIDNAAGDRAMDFLLPERMGSALS